MLKQTVSVFLASIFALPMLLYGQCLAQTSPKAGAAQHVPPKAVTPAPAPANPSDEYIQDSWERSGEALKGLFVVEKFQKGVGRNITLTVNCPSDSQVIGGGGLNSGMPVFHLMQSFPMGSYGWRVVFARDMAPLGPGQTGVVDLYPPSPYQILATAFCVNRTIWNKVMNSVK